MTNITNITTPTMDKEDNMLYIFETLVGLGDGYTTWAQVVTNCPAPSELTLYNRLMELRNDNHVIAAELLLKKETGREFRIKTIGDTYVIPEAEHAQRYGYNYRLEFIKLKERDEFGNVVDLLAPTLMPYIERRIKNSTRSWSTSTTTNILHIFKDGRVLPWDEFDSVLGHLTGNSRKQSKREAENSRVTELAFECALDEVGVHWYDYTEDEKGVDGHFVISYSCFLEAVKHVPSQRRQAQIMRAYRKGEMVSFNGRAMGDFGLIKGDCHVVPDAQLKAKFGYVPDLVTHECNRKPEKGLSHGLFRLTLTPHHPHHLPNVSSQLLSWGMNFFATQARLEQDYRLMVNEFVDMVSRGQFPKHLMSAAPLHDDDDNFNEVGYISALKDATNRWLASGMKLSHSSHLVKQHAGGFELKNKKAIMRLALPMPWATMAHSITVAVLEMGGWDLSGYDTTKMFWHAPTGRMAWPTQAFIDTYHRHGGHDLDDTHTTALRLAPVQAGETHNLTFDISGITWCVKAVNTRSPNGLSYFGENELPGEYSILDIDLGVKIVNFGFINLPVMNFPLYNVYGPIPGINMANAPKNTHNQVIENEELPQDDYSIDDHTYSPDDAIRQLYLALDNPGIGQIINPLIAYSVVFGTYPKHLPAYLEQMVDALEQTPDHEAFKKVLEAKADILIAIQHHTSRLVDHYIAERRLPVKVKNFLRKEGRITKDGPYTLMVEHMKRVMNLAMEQLVGDRNPNKKIRTKGLNITNREVIDELMGIEVDIECKKVAYSIIRFFGASRKGAPKQHFNKDAATNLYLRRNDPYMSYAVRQYFIGLNDKCVAKIDEAVANGVDRNGIMIALYQIIINENEEDDVLFQTSETGTLNGMMDHFMKTLFELGVIEEIIDPEGIEYGWTLG